MRLRFIGLGVPLVCLLLAIPAAADVRDWQGKQLTLQPLPNSSPWVHAQWEGGYNTARLSATRVFRTRKPEVVRVRAVKLQGRDVEFELQSEHLGRAKIQFENAGQWSETIWQEMLGILFTGEGVTAQPRFVGHTATHVLHFRGCNHHPPQDEATLFPTEAEAINAGYHLCPLCFKWFPAFSGFDQERQIAAFQSASIRAWGSPLMESAPQERVQQAGRAVLERWPLPLKGYRYRFVVIDSDMLNAAACADGQVYMTKALLDSLETEEELQSVLAHEIAHVEMRHTWRQLRAAQKASFWAGLATIAVAGATRSAEATDVAAMLSNFAANIVLSGFGRSYEDESDSLAAAYFEMNQQPHGRSALAQSLSKLLYGNQLLGIDPKARGGLFATHPDLPDRILKARTTQTGVLQNAIFEGITEDGEVVATLTFQMQRYFPGGDGADAAYELIALVDTTPVLGEKTKIRDIEIETDRGRIRLDNKEDVEVEPGDTVGAVFISKSQRGLFERITGINLTLRNARRWQRAERSEEAELSRPN